eukprot:SAG31_NODE_9327_length_1297_cov_1.162771_1_plen_314_part_01
MEKNGGDGGADFLAKLRLSANRFDVKPLDGGRLKALLQRAECSASDNGSSTLASPAGSSRLNEFVAGGWPKGKLTELVGHPGSGKTTLCALAALAAAARSSCRVLYIEPKVEHCSYMRARNGKEIKSQIRLRLCTVMAVAFCLESHHYAAISSVLHHARRIPGNAPTMLPGCSPGADRACLDGGTHRTRRNINDQQWLACRQERRILRTAAPPSEVLCSFDRQRHHGQALLGLIRGRMRSASRAKLQLGAQRHQIEASCVQALVAWWPQVSVAVNMPSAWCHSVLRHLSVEQLCWSIPHLPLQWSQWFEVANWH